MSGDGSKNVLMHRRQGLPVDAVEEILARLPAKQVLRCKVLSKTYYNLIKNPRFVEYHIQHRATSTDNINKSLIDVVPCYKGGQSINGIAYLQPSQSDPDLYVPVLDNFNKGFSFLSGSCNGLLCAEFQNVKDKPYTIDLDDKPKYKITENFVLWNPTTRDHMLLPHPRLGYSYDATGLGYDVATDDYKFVTVRRGLVCSNADAQFWSLKANRWRNVVISEPVFFEPCESERPAVDSRPSESQKPAKVACGSFIRGNLYWLASKKKNCGFSTLLVFDMANNSFSKQMTLPDDVRGDYSTSFVTEFSGSVALVTRFPSGVDDFQFDIWVLKMDGNDCKSYSWAKKISIGPFPAYVVPAKISLNGKFLFKDKSRTKEEEYFWYDPHNKEVKELRCHLAGFSTPWSFVESVAPLNRRRLQ